MFTTIEGIEACLVPDMYYVPDVYFHVFLVENMFMCATAQRADLLPVDVHLRVALCAIL